MKGDEELWSNLPGDVLSLIAAKLSAPELCMFRSTCKTWKRWFETSSTLYRPDLTSPGIKFPVLIRVHKEFCSFFHPMYNTTIRRRIPELLNATLFYAKGEWLLLGRRTEVNNDQTAKIFFFNIVTMVKIDVPNAVPDNAVLPFHRMCFFSNPDSTDWSIIGMNQFNIGTIEHGWPSWNVSRFRGGCMRITTNPVIGGGLCYCLGDDGTIFSFDPTKITSNDVTMLQKVSNPPPLLRRNHEINQDFLVSDEEDGSAVLAVFKHKIINSDTFVTSVYEFNVATRRWRKLDSLGNRMLFATPTGSVLVQVEEVEATSTVMTNMIKNKIYFPNFLPGNHAVFFSLSTDHCFLLNPNSSQPFGRATIRSFLPSNCGWIGPMPQFFFSKP